MFRSTRLKDEEFRSHRLNNALQTVCLIGFMLGFLGLLGFLLGGIFGIMWALFFGLLSFGIGQKVGPVLVLRLYRTRYLAPSEAPAL